MTTDQFAGRYDDLIRHPRMQALYGGSGYFNVGYWVDGIAGQAEACDRLVDELAAPIPRDAREILDVGCGLGAGTMRLARRFPEARVTGCNISPWQLAEAERRGLRHTVALDAADMPFGDGSADAIVAMESAQHFDTRAQFLSEAWRVLRPGGTISLADMLFKDREPVGSWMLPAGNFVPDPAAYAELLRDAGFEDVAVRDLTALTWAPHCAEMRRTSPGHADQIDRFERSLAHYIFAVGRRGPGRMR
jgi:cyclopropane fatty-acyl-phospholipid synthase-like methyltransferase